MYLIVPIFLNVLIVLDVHTVLFIYIFFCTRILASEPRCSIISAHFIFLLIDYDICTVIIKFNSIRLEQCHAVPNYLRLRR